MTPSSLQISVQFACLCQSQGMKRPASRESSPSPERRQRSTSPTIRRPSEAARKVNPHLSHEPLCTSRRPQRLSGGVAPNDPKRSSARVAASACVSSGPRSGAQTGPANVRPRGEGGDAIEPRSALERSQCGPKVKPGPPSKQNRNLLSDRRLRFSRGERI